ncbi:MAG: peptide chain release factor N(5)-glutamine methyltransferase [Candidatus Midichloria mitochondrii]|nr:peptide chain release factor N(5)-glutamine methyltransferase [Candidatus Midichloria mitochondrii]MDJ1256625.1 peptide chain release factor N(5)-glutamine methyltransferase [Candidatus Midichloria mitochondrii]MDJ1288373.1 peptide chain release factor N(5)-glutamine methyltransferase [Candidatus Midichloria mitochondrii]MDJ1299211.1 peptide chain release factor N(5)-glutamine methyltransferase [Candidatus Midichloria mitochondrii]MDJ1313314.1 peptide chain release factor N(5)-glutamine meth
MAQKIKQGLIRHNITATPDLEASLLLMHVLNIKDRERLFMLYEDEVDQEQIMACEALLKRRIEREPMAYILGSKEFWDYEFIVTPDVLIPRPETELIIETVKKCFTKPNEQLNILDLGTGTGCMPITLLKVYPNAKATGVDISDRALKIAQANADKLEVSGRIQFTKSNWFENIGQEKFDIITSNPPYISKEEWLSLEQGVKDYEPKVALTDDANGFACYEAILEKLPEYLKTDGKAFFEIGYNQLDTLSKLISNQGFNIDQMALDLTQIPRVVCASLTVGIDKANLQ